MWSVAQQRNHLLLGGRIRTGQLDQSTFNVPARTTFAAKSPGIFIYAVCVPLYDSLSFAPKRVLPQSNCCLKADTTCSALVSMSTSRHSTVSDRFSTLTCPVVLTDSSMRLLYVDSSASDICRFAVAIVLAASAVSLFATLPIPASLFTRFCCSSSTSGEPRFLPLLDGAWGPDATLFLSTLSVLSARSFQESSSHSTLPRSDSIFTAIFLMGACTLCWFFVYKCNSLAVANAACSFAAVLRRFEHHQRRLLGVAVLHAVSFFCDISGYARCFNRIFRGRCSGRGGRGSRGLGAPWVWLYVQSHMKILPKQGVAGITKAEKSLSAHVKQSISQNFIIESFIIKII
ncbi:uncharacterized protein LOC118512693 [Anopheles stephensi]|uniref:uncharacterized protein LOC118512693 n=1 Tax=Anopheles stephensi TaxID=30069 RepID=UPI001658C146|nr:uncharacterized protein LOC118512693 [Anopheles stephensi]XP_035913401.1 uncharacterized protein LOC118512693 [Anopheles stephensi]